MSNNGIGGFSFLNSTSQIEGNVSIDNVSVTQSGTTAPEPLLLLGTGGLAMIANRRRKKVAA